MAEVFEKLISQGYGIRSTSSLRFTVSQLSCRTFTQEHLQQLITCRGRERHLREVVICIGGFVGSDQDETLQISHFTQLQFYEPFDSLVFYVDKFDFLISCISQGVCTVAEGFEARYKEVMMSVLVAGSQVALELMPNPQQAEMKQLNKEKEKMKKRILEKQNRAAVEEEERISKMMATSMKKQQQQQRNSPEPMKIEEFVPSSSSDDSSLSDDNDETEQEEDPFLEEQRTRRMLLMAASSTATDTSAKSSSKNMMASMSRRISSSSARNVVAVPFDPRKYQSTHDEHMRLLMDIGGAEGEGSKENNENEINNYEDSTTDAARTLKTKTKANTKSVELDANGFAVDRIRKKKVLDIVPEHHSKTERRKWSFERFKAMIEEEEKLLEQDLRKYNKNNDTEEEGVTEEDDGDHKQQIVLHDSKTDSGEVSASASDDQSGSGNKNNNTNSKILLITKAEQAMFEAAEQKATVVKQYQEEEEEERKRRERRNMVLY